MSSLRRRTFIATLVDLLLGPQRSRKRPAGPGCTCKGCKQAWIKHQPPHVLSE
jgi:hypothetical protein